MTSSEKMAATTTMGRVIETAIEYPLTKNLFCLSGSDCNRERVGMATPLKGEFTCVIGSINRLYAF